MYQTNQMEKDFSNIDPVLQQMQDHALIQQIVENASRDIIACPKWHYREFSQNFDQTLIDLVCKPDCNLDEQKIVETAINKDAWLRHTIVWLKSWRSRSFPGRELIKQAFYALTYKTGS